MQPIFSKLPNFDAKDIYWSEEAEVTKTNGTKIEDVTSPYIHSELANGKKYFYVVTAVNSGVESKVSEEANGLLPPDPPIVKTAGAGDSKIILRWKGVTGAETYNIYWSEESDLTKTNGTKIENVNSPYTHSSLTKDKTYYYVVTALNSSGESNDSNILGSTPDSAFYSDDFENGLVNWSADGIWEVGKPTSGPNECYAGSGCAATILGGNYPDFTDSRLVSESIQLPAIETGEEIHLRFWHWFNFKFWTSGCCDWEYDYGRVQVSEQTSPGSWSSWSTLTTYSKYSGIWTNALLDLSAYAGKKIRVGFLLDNDAYEKDGHRYGSVSSGWYIDEILINIEQTYVLSYEDSYSYDFESGMRGWSSHGIWEGGFPTSGPSECHQNFSCVATILGGNYPDFTDSRLVSESIQLPAIETGEEIHLRFWHWFNFKFWTSGCCDWEYDYGRAQVSEQTSPGSWSSWNTLTTYSKYSGIWTNALLDLSAYAGKKIRIGFLLDNDAYERDGHRYGSVSSGWYIDEVLIEIR